MSSDLCYLYDVQDETDRLPILLKMYRHRHKCLMIWRSPGICGEAQISLIFLAVGNVNPFIDSIRSRLAYLHHLSHPFANVRKNESHITGNSRR